MQRPSLPSLGQDNDNVLGELGYSERDIAELPGSARDLTTSIIYRATVTHRRKFFPPRSMRYDADSIRGTAMSDPEHHRLIVYQALAPLVICGLYAARELTANAHYWR